MSETFEVPIAEIDRRGRKPRAKIVAHFRACIKDGLDIAPLRVWKNDAGKFALVSGGVDYLVAAEEAGWTNIECELLS